MTKRVVGLPRADLEFRSHNLNVENRPIELMEDALHYTLADLGLAPVTAGCDTLCKIVDYGGESVGHQQAWLRHCEHGLVEFLLGISSLVRSFPLCQRT